MRTLSLVPCPSRTTPRVVIMLPVHNRPGMNHKYLILYVVNWNDLKRDGMQPVTLKQESFRQSSGIRYSNRYLILSQPKLLSGE
jgi:hypothetical protein